MTDKKRLEEIKTWLNRDFDLTEEDIDWLIEQAGRVQELEEELVKYRNSFELQLLINNNIKNQIKRYREALKNIYDLAEYNEYDNTLEQIVSEVEKALEELE